VNDGSQAPRKEIEAFSAAARAFSINAKASPAVEFDICELPRHRRTGVPRPGRFCSTSYPYTHKSEGRTKHYITKARVLGAHLTPEEEFGLGES
jgi:hypothetical protein